MKMPKVLLAPEPPSAPSGGGAQPATPPPSPAPAPAPEPAEPPVEPGGITPPAEPATPAEPTAPKDTLLNLALGLLKPAEQDAQPAPEPAAEPAPAPVTPPAEPAAQPTPPAGKKKPRIKIVQPADVALVEPTAAAVPAPVIVPPAAPAPTADSDYIKTLTPEQQDELIEAEVAEQLDPKHKGLKERLVKYYRDFDERIKPILQENPDADINNSQALRELADRKPKLTVSESKKVQRHIGQEEAKKAVRAELEPQIEEVKRSQRRVELEPKVKAFANDTFVKGVEKLATEQFADSQVGKAMLAIKTDPKAKDDFKLEAQMYHEEKDAAVRRCEKLLMMVNGVMNYDPRKPDADIEFVSKFVEDEGKALSGRVFKGKTFLPRSQFMQLIQSNPGEAASFSPQSWSNAKYCTFTTENILDMIAHNAVQTANLRAKAAVERAESLGYTRQPKANNPKPATPPPADSRSPRTTPTPAPGAAKTVPAPVPPAPGINVTKTLYPPAGRR